eukprot:m51a1_g4485 hypothetical protein (273) ;mRNA; f:280735-282156
MRESQRRSASAAAGLVRQDFREETRKVWSRPIERLPIAIDLPRLAAHVHIVDARQTPESAPARDNIPDESGAKPCAYDHVLRVLLGIARSVEGEERANAIREQYEKSIMRDADLSIQKSAITNLIVNTIGPSTKTASLLRAVNQAIVAPSAIELRMFLLPGIQMKDSQKNPWEVIIRVGEDKVEVSHLRKQCHFDTRQTQCAFEFTWEVSMEFDTELREIAKVNLWLLRFSFGPETSEEKRRDLTAAFQPLVSKHADERNTALGSIVAIDPS